jgi:hypothetical protein
MLLDHANPLHHTFLFLSFVLTLASVLTLHSTYTDVICVYISASLLSNMIFMFVSMLFIHLFVMPWIMIDGPSDFRISINQIYGGIFMAAAMVALESFVFMYSGSLILAMLALMVVSAVCIRYQIGIDDTMYLRDMIPHHSMAIVTSRPRIHRARDPRVQKLSETILNTQLAEIHQMKNILIK